MALYDSSVIEEIKANINIVDVISGYVALKRHGRNYFGLCPFHNEKSPSFSVSESKQIFHCFGCGVGGDALGFLMKIENITFKEAIEILAEKADEVYSELSKYFMCDYDEAGSIGKRYRREDEIGTPFCVTVDFDTLEDGCVTVRDRDTMEQIRIKIEDIRILKSVYELKRKEPLLNTKTF